MPDEEVPRQEVPGPRSIKQRQLGKSADSAACVYLLRALGVRRLNHGI